MMSVRALARAVPKVPLRPTSSLASRSLSTVQRPQLLQSSLRLIAAQPITKRTFTVSSKRYEPAGQVDTELAAKLEQELSLETASKDPEALPEPLQDFVESGGFNVQDTPGSEEVVLTKQFGDETIKITFSIADLNALDEDPDQYNEDSALADEDDMDDDLTPQSTGPRSKGTINSGRTNDGNFNVAPEDSVAPADRPELTDDESAAIPEEDEDEDLSPGFPTRINVTITKSGSGALQLETVAQDGLIDIENVYYFPKADLADAQTAEKDFKRQSVYAGPPFNNLDEELQILFEKYLDERGVNTALAQFVPDYIDWKEQREYVNWLNSVKGFIDA